MLDVDVFLSSRTRPAGDSPKKCGGRVRVWGAAKNHVVVASCVAASEFGFGFHMVGYHETGGGDLYR